MLTDPQSLAELTPLIRSIEASGSKWLWKLNGVEALGMKVEAAFTERMDFIDKSRIVFTHDPPAGAKELAGVDGVYDVTPAGGEETGLRIDLTLSVELPVPRLAAPAVERVLTSTMRITGRQFASNLYRRLDLDPSTAQVNELPSRP